MGVINKVRDVLINILKNYYIYIIGIALFTYKALFLNISLGMNIGSEMYIISLAVPMLILLPTLSKNQKFNKIYFWILYTIITILIYSNYIYFNYSNNFLSIYQIENLKYAKEIGMGLWYVIDIGVLLLYWLDNIVLLVISIILSRRKVNIKVKYGIETEIEEKKKRKKSIVLRSAFCVIVLILNILIMTNKIDRTYKYYTYNKTLMVEHISIYYYHIEDIKEYIRESFFKEKPDYELISEIYEDIRENKTEQTEYTAIANGSNVIILQLESLNEFIINTSLNGQEITPNLNKFFAENVYCTEMYNQGLGTTADSEHTMLNSLFPLENGRVFQKYYNNKWLDLFSELKSNGYYTSFMHPNVSDFWNRYQVYNLGYKIDEYNDISKFDSNGEMAGEFFSDEQFFTQTVEKMKEYKEPFCTLLVSITTHIPYSLEGISNLEEKLNIDVSNIPDEETRNYLLSCNFVDYSFGVFMQELEESGLLDNSILVVYGDHGAGLQNIEWVELLFTENGRDYDEYIDKLKDTHIPFGIKIPQIDINMVIDSAKEKMDIKPTILDLLGVEDSLSLGESIFTQKDHAFIKGIGVVTKDVYYIDEEYIDRGTLDIVMPNEGLIYLSNRMKDEMIFSDSIIKNNLIQRYENNESK